MTTLYANFSDKAIRTAQADAAILRMRDARYPMELRFLASREQATWFYIWNADGRAHYRKIGRWPLISAKAAIALLPDIAAEVARKGADARVAADHWQYTAELLAWYRDRVQQDAQHSKRWQAIVRSTVNKHLIPCLGDLPLAEVSRAQLDARLFAPLQAQLAASTIDLIWRVLVNACRRATRLHLLARNPVDGMVISDFLRDKPVSQHGVLRAQHVPEVMSRMHAADPPLRTLVVLMLCHGTRVGETRAARWGHLDLVAGEWYIPAENAKTRKAHRLPLTPALCQWLADYHAWQQQAGQACVYLFPARGKRKPLSDREVSRLIQEVSRGEWTARSLRSLARTVWADLGVDYLVAETLLNHAMRQLDTAYIHTQLADRCRAALETHQQWLAQRGSLCFQHRPSAAENESHNPAENPALRDSAA